MIIVRNIRWPFNLILIMNLKETKPILLHEDFFEVFVKAKSVI